MNSSFINNNILKNISFCEMNENNNKYQYYIDAKKELKNQLEFKDIIDVIEKSSLKDIYVKQMNDFNTNLLYKSDIHGLNHNIRVCFFAFVISTIENITTKDFSIIMEACKYHDIGRVNDFEDKTHGKNSSEMLSFLDGKYSDEDIKYLKTIITCHSINDSEFENIAAENKINDISRCKKMYEILKDSDGLDRVRLEYPVINVNYLRTDIAKKMILFAYDLFNNYNKVMNKKEFKMNSIECKKYSKQKYRGNIRVLVNKQIDKFFEIENSNYKLEQHNYKIGDNVILDKYNYLHGIGKNENAIDFVAENGILSKEATGDLGNHAFQFVVGLWRVKNKITLQDYIKNYSGIIAKYNNINEQVPYGKIDEFVEKMKDVDHWLWKSESSMEIRFMPSLARNINQIGFILDLSSDDARELIKNDINDVNYNKKISNNFIKKDLRKKDFFNNKDNAFLERASYVIFGINKCFIEGIIVGRDYENDNDKLSMLKKKFPNCYICNLDGEVIK